MSRRFLITILTVGASLGLSIPAFAKGEHAAKPAHRQMTLVMTRKWYKRAIVWNRKIATVATASIPQILLAGFRCETTVAYGTSGQIAKNYFGDDSVEWEFAYTQGGVSLESVSSTCLGQLPGYATRPKTIVNHWVACGQYTPSDAPTTIRGYGIATTFPDGRYIETCNTPNYS